MSYNNYKLRWKGSSIWLYRCQIDLWDDETKRDWAIENKTYFLKIYFNGEQV